MFAPGIFISLSLIHICLTINSSNMGDAVLTPKGDKLYYCAAFESGYDLWERNFKENSTKILIKGVGGGRMFADKKGEKDVYKRQTVNGSWCNISLSADGTTRISVSYTHLDVYKRQIFYRFQWLSINRNP